MPVPSLSGLRSLPGVLLAVSLALACTGPAPAGGTAADPARSSPAASLAPPIERRPSPRRVYPRPVPAPEPSLPAPSPWQPAPAEVEPQAKVAAARLVEALGTTPGAGDPATRLVAAGADPALAAQAGPLLPPASPGVTEVIYAQYGGLEPAAASVMVLSRLSWLEAGAVAERVVTTDVRLERSTGGWQVRELRPAAAPPPAAAVGPEVAALLASDRVDLPAAARADLAAGTTSAEIVTALTRLSAVRRLSVTVLSAGHPFEVFGTDRQSNHTRGRAVDIWALDGVRVIDMAPGDPRLLALIRDAQAAGSDEIGSPTDPDGPGGVFFANALHRDHVHVGFEVSAGP